MLYKLNPLTQYTADSPFNLASAKRLRVYIYAQINGTVDSDNAESIAQLIGVGTTVEDVLDAIGFWNALYILIPTENTENTTNSNNYSATPINVSTPTIQNIQEFIQQIGFRRRLTQDEFNIVQQWFKAERNILLVQEAYSRTVKNTGKSNVMYMNKMLLNWERQCIYTIDDLRFVEQTLLPQ